MHENVNFQLFSPPIQAMLTEFSCCWRKMQISWQAAAARLLRYSNLHKNVRVATLDKEKLVKGERIRCWRVFLHRKFLESEILFNLLPSVSVCPLSFESDKKRWTKGRTSPGIQCCLTCLLYDFSRLCVFITFDSTHSYSRSARKKDKMNERKSWRSERVYYGLWFSCKINVKEGKESKASAIESFSFSSLNCNIQRSTQR